MFLYFGYAQVFILFIVANASMSSNNDSSDEEKSVFADVIKNITRVNNVLQELIKNYEKLQKIYKSQELLENEYSSREDQNEDFMIRNSKVNKRTKDKYTTRKQIFPATQMIISAENREKESDQREVNEVEEIDSKEINSIKKAITVEKPSRHKKRTTPQKTVVPDEVIKDDDDTKEKLNVKGKQPTEPRLELVKQKYYQKKRLLRKDSKELNIKHTPENEEATNIKQKTSVSKGNNNIINIEIKDPGDSAIPVNLTTKMIKKQIIKSEKFSSGKIWEDITNNKPVNLETERVVIYSKRHDQSRRLRSTADSTETTEELAKQKKRHKTKKIKQEARSPESIEDEKNIKKEQFKTSILRKAYGDACLKVVVKKCYKACKASLKAACVKVACKSSLQLAFKSYAKKGCVREFREQPVEPQPAPTIPRAPTVPTAPALGRTIPESGPIKSEAERSKLVPDQPKPELKQMKQDTENVKSEPALTKLHTLEPVIVTTETEGLIFSTNKPVSRTSNTTLGLKPQAHRSLHIDSDFQNIRRNGYLAAACLPKMNSQSKRKLDAAVAAGKSEVELNILRDRFERACQKTSSEKCTQACYYAADQTCRTYDCSSARKKALKRDCRRQCKRMYRYAKSSESDSNESPSSSSVSRRTSASSSSSLSSEEDIQNNTEASKKGYRVKSHRSKKRV